MPLCHFTLKYAERVPKIPLNSCQGRSGRLRSPGLASAEQSVLNFGPKPILSLHSSQHCVVVYNTFVSAIIQLSRSHVTHTTFVALM